MAFPSPVQRGSTQISVVPTSSGDALDGVAVVANPGVVEGDVILVWWHSGQPTSNPDPSFTVLGTLTDFNNRKHWFGYKIATASEPAEYHFSPSVLTYYDSVRLAAFSGCDVDAAIESFSLNYAATSTNQTTTAITPLIDNNLLFAFFMDDESAYTVTTPPGSPWTTLGANRTVAGNYTDAAYVRDLGSSSAGVPSPTAALVWNGVSNGIVAQFLLRPGAKPTIGTQPADQTAADGSTATFTIGATAGSGTLTYQWHSVSPDGLTDLTVSGATSSSYTTGTLSRADAGTMVYCVVNDGGGSPVNSARALLRVTKIPASYSSGSGQVVGAGYIGEGMIGAPVASSGPTATLAVTEAPDSLAAAATVAVAAALGVTEAPDALSSAAALSSVASLAKAEANDSLSSAAAAALTASAAATEASDSLSSSATAAIVASLVVTEANDTAASAATGALAAALAQTEAPDTVASAATGLIAASLSGTEAPDTLSSVSVAALVAELVASEAPDTLVAAASGASGANLAVTEAPDTLVSAAGAALAIGLAVVETADTVVSVAAATGVADLVITEADDTLLATAIGDSGANLAVIEAPDTVVSTAAVSAAGAVSVVEMEDVLESSAQMSLSAAFDIVEAGDILVADAHVLALVNASIFEADDTLIAVAHSGTSGGGGATPEEVWDYVLSNGLTAGETLAQALAEAQRCCGGH